MSPLAIGAIVIGISVSGFLGFLACAIFSSKAIAEWRNRLLDLAQETQRAGRPVPYYATVEKTEFMAYMRRPRVKRGRPIIPALVVAVFTAVACGLTIFLCQAAGIGSREALTFAVVCGTWSGAGAWALWAGWPMRRPRVGQTFVEKWANRIPVSMERYCREDFIRKILEAVDVDVEKSPS